MTHTLFMAVVDRLEYLFEYVARFEFAKKFLFYDLIEELTAIAKLRDEVDIFGILKVLVELQNVRMIESLQDLNLILKPLLVLDLLPGNCFACPDLFC